MADKPTIPDFPNVPDFRQMITQSCEVIANVRGIPYDFNGTLSLENKFVVLFKTVKAMFDAQETLAESYKELYDFVKNYFDNLDVQKEINTKIDAMIADGTFYNLFVDVMPYATPEMFGAVGDGTTDDTEAFKKALENMTAGTLLLGKKKYLITQKLIVPTGINITGLSSYNDISGKKDGETDLFKNMSCIIVKESGHFELEGNNSVEKVCIAYPDQNYNIESTAKGTAFPDGLTNFKSYPPTFVQGGSNIGSVLRDIVYLGGSTIFYSGATENPEKLLVNHVVGMATDVAFKIVNCSDMMVFDDIVLNPNSLKVFLNGASDVNLYTKLAKNAVAFSFGEVINGANYGCDGTYLTNCFGYGVKSFIELYGDGNSPQCNNCGCDACHQFLYVKSHYKPFGTYLNNCTCVPVVYKAIVDGKETDRSPCLVRIDDGISDHFIDIVNCTVFGGKIAFINDTDTCDTVFWCGSNCLNTKVNLVNSRLTAKNLQHGFNSIGANNVDQSVVNYYTVLTLTNSTLNGKLIDSNINKSKLVLSSYTIATGQQTIEIGFKANSLTVVAEIDDYTSSSIGMTDGINSYADCNFSGTHFLSGGNAILGMLGKSISDRVYFELSKITDTGIVLNWGLAGSESVAPIGKVAHLIILANR